MEDPLATLSADVIALLRHHNLLRPLVERQVIEEAVGAIALDEQGKENARRLFLRSNGVASEEALQQFLTSNGLTSAELEHQIEMPLRIRKFSQERFQSKAEARFLSRKNQLDRVVYSLLRVTDGLLARELYLRIAAGEATFAELAALHAEGPEKATNGIVGPVPLTQAHPILAERLRTTSPGVLLEPFQVAEWWLVVRLETYTPAVFDEAMAAQMASELFSEWVQEQTLARMARLNPSRAVAASPA